MSESVFRLYFNNLKIHYNNNNNNKTKWNFLDSIDSNGAMVSAKRKLCELRAISRLFSPFVICENFISMLYWRLWSLTSISSLRLSLFSGTNIFYCVYVQYNCDDVFKIFTAALCMVLPVNLMQAINLNLIGFISYKSYFSFKLHCISFLWELVASAIAEGRERTKQGGVADLSAF